MSLQASEKQNQHHRKLLAAAIEPRRSLQESCQLTSSTWW